MALLGLRKDTAGSSSNAPEEGKHKRRRMEMMRGENAIAVRGVTLAPEPDAGTAPG